LIYLDYNATAPLWPQVAELLSRGYASFTGNPSSVHKPGREARARLVAARDTVARLLGCAPKDVVFTSGGSEGAALAIKGAYRGGRVVTTPFEHPCVLGAIDQLGADVVRTKDVLSALDGAKLVSVMAVNNETGQVFPVADIARECAARGVPFFCDAVQAVSRVPLPQADFLSISAHKFGGPPGVGVLVARQPLTPLIPGHQENGRRGGTVPVVLAEACALALKLTLEANDGPRLEVLRKRFEDAVTSRIAGVVVNAGDEPRAPGTSNLRFEDADGEALLIALDLEGIHVSTGAACASGSLRPSHVLTAMGLSSSEAQSSLRFSMGRSTTEADLDTVVEALVRHVPAARGSS
jgi:cysteine desulfurase